MNTNPETILRIRIKLVRATFYGLNGKSNPKIYLTGILNDPIIQNNQITLKQGRRVQILYTTNNLPLALSNIAQFDSDLTFLVNWSSEILKNTIVDYQGNEVVKLQSESLCERSKQ